MTRMIAAMDFPYFGKGIKAGDEFDAEPRDVEVLVIAGRAETVGEKAAYQTRAMTAGNGRRRATKAATA